LLLAVLPAALNLWTAAAGLAQVPLHYQLPNEAVLGRLGMERAWWAQAVLDPVRDRVQFLTSDEQLTYVQSDRGMVTAFDNATGRRMWSIQIGAPTEIRFALNSNDTVALVVSGTRLSAIDKAKGDLYWQVAIPSAPSTSPGIDDTRAYVGAINGNLYAFNLTLLDQLAKQQDVAKYEYRALSWSFRTGARVSFAPVSTGNVVCVPSNDGSLYGLGTQDHAIRFQFETDSPISAPVTQRGPLVWFATGDMKLYCINAENATLKWELLTGLHIRKAPRAVGEHLFFLAEGGEMHCLDADTGRTVWVNRQANGFLAGTPNVVYASDGLGNVLLINRADGRYLGGLALPGFPVRLSNDRTDRVYMASERGLVICLREQGREFPLFHKSPEKRPVLPDVAPEEGSETGQPPAAARPGAAPKAAGAPAARGGAVPARNRAQAPAAGRAAGKAVPKPPAPEDPDRETPDATRPDGEKP
jgi:outer membrane protein assembly factor BamB